ncbi:MAG: DUF3667 domain-containing protein [Proteobacteria bacterium]|nr:DUF3667 domain-containing protein [Pseudomonadota bacterium]
MLPVAPVPRYCWQCGQDTLRIVPPLRRRARDAVDRYVRTLVALIARPGRLTEEYIANRRERYLPPLRLYLTASFLFFLIVKVLGATGSIHVVVAPMVDNHGHAVTATSNPAAYQAEMAKMHACVDHPGSCSWGRTLASRIALAGDAQSSHPEVVAQRMIARAPNAVFMLLPVFAALLMLAYRRRRYGYATHFVFSLHMHAFWFLALLVLWQLPPVALPIGVLMLAAHAWRALQRVYGGRWWVTLGRAGLVVSFYLLALAATVVGLSIASVIVT